MPENEVVAVPLNRLAERKVKRLFAALFRRSIYHLISVHRELSGKREGAVAEIASLSNLIGQVVTIARQM